MSCLVLSRFFPCQDFVLVYGFCPVQVLSMFGLSRIVQFLPCPGFVLSRFCPCLQGVLSCLGFVYVWAVKDCLSFVLFRVFPCPGFVLSRFCPGQGVLSCQGFVYVWAVEDCPGFVLFKFFPCPGFVLSRNFVLSRFCRCLWVLSCLSFVLINILYYIKILFLYIFYINYN